MRDHDPIDQAFVLAFDAELEPRPDDDARLDAMVAAAMAAAPIGPAGSGPGSGGAESATGTLAGGGSSAWLIGGALALAAVGLGVALLLAGRPGGDDISTSAGPGDGAPVASTIAAPEVPGPAVSDRGEAVPTEEEAEEEAEGVADPHAAHGAFGPEADGEEAESEEAQAEPAGAHRSADETPAPQAPARKPHLGPDAAELLRQANEARRARDFAGADRLFRQLARAHRGSREELLARVTHGELLLLEMGKPAAALRRFDAYLAAQPRGTVAEEALVGRARALGRLARAEDEAETWRLLLQRFPGTVRAATARARIAELGP